MKILLFVFLLICLTGTASAVNLPGGYVSGYSLNSSGTTYVLTGNILANTTAFSIEANDIVFDGKGHTIDCGLTGTGVGIVCSNQSNITIKNVNIVQHNSSISSYGILTKNITNVLISNCSASSIAGSGIYVSGPAAIVNRCKTSSIKGIPLYIAANNSRVTNCSAVSNSHYAICFTNASNNKVSNCTGRTNTNCGIDFTLSNNNDVSNCAGYSNTSHGISFTKCNYNKISNSTGYTNSSTGGSGIYLMDTSNNTFINSRGSSYQKFGIYLNNTTKYNTFINCIGESFGSKSIYQGIWFSFSSAACSGTNAYKNCNSRSVLATTCTDSNKSTWLAMGDSITAGGAAGIPYGAYIHYANVSLWNRGYVFFNAGLGGETAASGRIRFLDEVAVFNPEYVTIMYGANDLKFMRSQQAIIDDILWMASQAKARGATPVILLTSTRRGAELSTTYLDRNLSAQALAAGYDVFNVYDIIDTIPNNSQYDGYNVTNYVDSVHPTQAANKLIGDALVKYITTLNNPPVVSFWASRTSGTVPITLGFTDASTNTPTAWKWDFGDGTFSTVKSPRHTYTSAGTYSVTLTVSNEAGSASKTRHNYITLTGTTTQKKPVTSFSSNTTSGKEPLSVAFTDTSTGSPTAWNWNFGDGTANSTVKSPMHVYSKAGSYTVTLTASNSAGSNTVTKSSYIKATAGTTTIKPPVVSFWASRTTGTTSTVIGFTDASTNTPTAWKWNFGDGTSSTAKSPRHTYSKAGTYSITLTTSNAGGSGTKTRYNYIKIT